MRSLSAVAAAALLTTVPAAGEEAQGYVQTERGRVEITGTGTFFGTVTAPVSVSRGAPQAARTSVPVILSGAPPQAVRTPVPVILSGAPPQAVRSRRTATWTLTANPDPCRAPRSAYLRQLLRTAGIEVDDPLALLDGLAGERGYEAAALFTPYGLLPGIDPIRPLAWDSELRRLGRELARCSAGER